MTAAEIRRARKTYASELLRAAQVPAAPLTALYLGVLLAMDALVSLLGGEGLLPLFFSVLTFLLAPVLHAGFVLYCMAVRRRERADWGVLLDALPFAGKVILLYIFSASYIFVLSLLFIVPGLIAAYRLRFALYHLCEDPSMPVAKAILLSRAETRTGKWELFLLDLTYLPWILLRELPRLFFDLRAVFAALQTETPSLAALAAPLTLPQLLFTGAWALAASTLFLAHMKCVDLDYFDAARERLGASGENLFP
ncbi:MAG: DUF975 family protein [Oscillibacter sp.]|nr:DUF975 family protein [Oscillibacter sp.]